MFLLPPESCCTIKFVTKLNLYLSYVLSGSLLGSATFFELGWVLALLGLYIFLIALLNTTTWQSALIGSCITFLIKSLIVTAVFYSLFPLSWLLASSAVAVILVGSYWFYSALGAILGGVITGFVWWYVLKLKIKAVYKLIVLPVIWVAGEWLGSYFYAVLMMGEGVPSTLAPSAGFLGHTLVYHAGLLGVAEWGGVFSLSLALSSLVLVLVWLRRQEEAVYRKWIFGTIMVLLVVTSFRLFNQPETSDLPTIAIVETDFTVNFMRLYQSREEFRRREILLEAVGAATQLEPAFIILPEDTRFISGHSSPAQALGFYRFAFGGTRSILIDSARTDTPQGAYLRASIYVPLSDQVWQADKQSLIPLGEYLPSALSHLLGFIRAPEERALARERLNFRPGPLSNQSKFSDYLPGVIFCFESLDPWAVWRLRRDRELPFVAHLVSHAWFNDDTLLKRLVAAPLLTQARFSQVPIVSAANASVSQVYWPSGYVETPPVVAEGDGWRVRLVGTDSR